MLNSEALSSPNNKKKHVVTSTWWCIEFGRKSGQHVRLSEEGHSDQTWQKWWSMDQSGGGEPVGSVYIKGRTEKIPVDVTEKNKGVQANLSFMRFMPK